MQESPQARGQNVYAVQQFSTASEPDPAPAWYSPMGEPPPGYSLGRPYVSFGGLAEFELTTRLGLTFRWTQDWLPTASADTRGFVSSWSVGLAVY